VWSVLSIWFTWSIWFVLWLSPENPNKLNKQDRPDRQNEQVKPAGFFYNLLKHKAEYSDIHTVSGMDLPTEYQSASFMTVRGEIAEPRRETGARSPEAPMRTRAVRLGAEGRASRPQACRSNGSAIAAEALMNNAD
jgi:hypothetical protein